MTAPSGRARIRISADVDPELGAAIDRTMRRAQEAVDRRMRGIEDSSARAGDAMGRDFDAAYRRMEQGANRVNTARAREEQAIARVQQAQQRAADAQRRNTTAAENHSDRLRRLDAERMRTIAEQEAATRRLITARERSQRADTNDIRARAAADREARRAAELLAASQQRLRDISEARRRADRAASEENLRNTRAQRDALDQLARAEQARADAESRRRQSETDFDRARRDVVDIDTRLNDGDAIRGMTRLRMRLQAMAARPIRQNVEVVMRGLSTILRMAAGITALVTALGGLGIAAGAAIIPVAGLVASLSSMAGASLALPGILAGIGTVLGAVVVGFTGLGDAIKQVAAEQDALLGLEPAALAMSRLSDAGRDLTTTLVGLRPQWYALRNTVQDALLVGVGGAIEEVVRNRLPLLSQGLAAVAAGVNVGLVGALNALSNDEGGAALATLLHNSAAAARDFGAFLGPAVQALLNLVSIGSDYLPGLTRGFEGAGQAFLAWTRDADAVRATIDRGIEVARQWGSVLSDVGAIITDVFTAANASGVGGGGLGLLLDRLASWSGSSEGQTALISFFTAVRDALSAATPVLTTFLGIIGQLAPHAARIVEAFAPFVNQVLVALGDALDRVGPLLPDLADAFGRIAVEVAGLLPGLAEIAVVILPVLADVLRVLAPILPLIIAGFMGFKIASVVAAAIGAVTTAVQVLTAAFAANPLGMAVIAIAALAAAAVYCYQRFDWFRNAVDGAVRHVAGVITWLWTDIWSPVMNAIGTAAVWVWTNMIRPAFDAWAQGMGYIAAMAQWLWTGVIVPVWNGLGAAIGWVIDNVVRPGFQRMTDAVGAVGTAFSTAVDWIGQVWDRIRSIAAKPARFVVETVYNHGIRAAWNKVAGWLNLPELPEAQLGNLGSFARGGVLPGYTPGRDVYTFIEPRTGQRIRLGGGEGILVPEAVDMLGGEAGIDNLNRRARGGRGGSGSLDTGYALGGVIDRRLWELVRAKFPGLQLTSALRPGDPGHHGSGQAVDVSDGYDTTPLMQAAARYFYTAYGSQLAELIHWPLAGWQNIKNGRPMMYSSGTNQEHRNHVHLAATGVLGAPGAEVTEGGDGFFGSMFGFMRQQVANTVDAVLSPIGERIPDFGDSPMGRVPKAAFGYMKDKVVGFLSGKADEVDAASGAAELGGYGGNAQFYLSEMVRAVKSMGMDKLAAVIAAATMLVETNLKMYANRSDPASLTFPHDAVGSDHDSSGLYQQRNNGAWGTIAERMNPFASSIMFLRRLKSFAYWNMDPGAAAQKVQVSAYPGKYSQRMAEARRLVDPLFDSGGLAYGRGLMMKDVIRPERVLSPAQTEAFDRLVDALTLTGSGTVNIGGLNLTASGSVSLRRESNAQDRPGGGSDGGGSREVNVNANIVIHAADADDAARQFGARLTSLIA